MWEDSMAEKEGACSGDALPEDVLVDVARILLGSSPQFPYLDHSRPEKKWAEREKVRDWAEEMKKHGHVVRKVRSNDDDPPDVLAEMDGSPICVEVTDLLEYVSEKCERQATWIFDDDQVKVTVTWKRNGDQEVFLRWEGEGLTEDHRREIEQEIRDNPHFFEEAWKPWSSERFRERLSDRIKTKDCKLGAKKEVRLREHGENALDHRLSQNFLLVFTPEMQLQAWFGECLKETEFARPRHFDRVFVMGVRRGGRKDHPVAEVQLA